MDSILEFGSQADVARNAALVLGTTLPVLN